MSGESAGTVARIIYNAYGTREFEKAARWFAEDAEILSVPTGDRYRGRDGYLQLARAWAAAFPDLKVEIVRVGGGSGTAAVEYALRGTHTGALVSPGVFVPPTWAQVEIRLCDVLELRGGKVARVSSYFDSASLLRQMGLLPHSPMHGTERRAALGLFATEVDSSVEQRNKAIVQRFLEEVVNQKNPEVAASICAPDLAWHGGSIGETRDLASFRTALTSVFASFPDLHLEIHDLIAEADRVAVRVTLHGTHLGAFQGVQATGKRIVSTGINSYRVSDDRILEAWWQHDLLGVMQQLDAVSALARGGA